MSDAPKIYIRLVNWSYEPTTIQVITLDKNEAFLLMPEDMYGLDTEVHVWQDNKKIEVWKWDTKSRSYIKEKW